MAKNRKKPSAMDVLNKAFLKNLQQKYVKNQKGKTASEGIRTRIKSKDSKREKDRAQTVRPKNQVSKSKLPGKSHPKHKVQIHEVTRSTGRKGAKQKAKPNTKLPRESLAVAKQTRKTGKQLDFSFKRIRNVNRKIQAFQEGSQKSIKKQLAKNDGKPPRGIVVVVTDKYGREAAAVSPLNFVVNEKSVEKFTTKFLKELSKDHLAWKDIQKKRRKKPKGKKRKGRNQSDDYADYLDDDSSDEEGYGNYNPENVSNISIKFIY